MFILFITASIFAEYRAYLLDVKLSEDKHIILLSNLDHVQYPAWNSGFEKVSLLDSWMCYGDTSNFKKPCEKDEKAEDKK